MKSIPCIVLCIASIALGCSSEEGPPDVAPGDLRTSVDDYYVGVDMSDPVRLQTSLHELIKDHRRIDFTAETKDGVDVWHVIEQADADPARPGFVLDVYRNASFERAGGSNPSYHREHVWPKSVGFPDNDGTDYPYTDAHGIMIADAAYNVARGERHFDDCVALECESFSTEVNNGAGGPGVSNKRTGGGTTGIWEVWDGRKGDIARALFYMDVRYEGGTHADTGREEPNLVVVDDISLIVSSIDNRQPRAFMGRLSTLLRWHNEDPPSAEEKRRNDIIEFYQGNRNPFIDRPMFANMIFESRCEGRVPGPGETPWINELHYDNTGDPDTDEGVEIAGPAGIDLAGHKLVFYNGSAVGDPEEIYATVDLTGTLIDQGGCAGTIFFSQVPIQNGGPDGIALAGPGDALIQFLSYEGAFTAAAGPAAGVQSQDIGVSESNSDVEGNSLQLFGNGCSFAEFTWGASPIPQTRDGVNTGQTFTCTQ